MFFHTLPYFLSSYCHEFENSNMRVESTCPNGDRYDTYSRGTHLLAFRPPSTDRRLPRLRFPNVRHLQVTFPFAERFWSIFARFEQLTSVSGDFDGNPRLALSQLQQLLTRAPHLRLLIIAHWESSSIQRLPFQLASNTLRRVDLQSEHYMTRDREQCITLLCSTMPSVADHASTISSVT